MGWGQLGVAANVALTAAYIAIAASILVPLARTGQLFRNRLGLFTGLIFFSCGIGHAIHAEHAIANVVADGWGAAGIDGHLAAWDGLTAVIAITYWNLRRTAPRREDAGTLFEDLQRRQRELEQEALEAGVREQLAVERALVAGQWFARAFEAAPTGKALLDAGGRITRANSALAELVEQPAPALIGRPLTDLVAAEDHPRVRELVGAAVAGDAGAEVRLDRTDGRPAWARLIVSALDDDGSALLVQSEDVTERRSAEARLEHLALHDPLTGLPNRVLFHDRAEVALHQDRRARRYTGCLFVDLDHFKVVNDSLGHAAGDEVLQALAGRIAGVLRPADTVARMGGDEFCLLLPALERPEEATAIAERVLAAVEGYVEVDGIQVTTAASVGVAVAPPSEAVTSQMLVRDSDAALYRAKRNGRGHQVVFDETIRDQAQRRLQVEAELRQALDRGELRVAYQPQWSLASGTVVGLEALARWDHPERGELLPDRWLGVAIETGLVLEVGRQVRRQSFEALVALRRAHPTLALSVNLSAREVAAPGLVDGVLEALAEAGLPTTALCVELTESDLFSLGGSALDALSSLRAEGVRLAVDDVGTGQSSLTHLVTLPVDVIKIDRSFVEQVHVPGAARAVVEALLSMAKAIGVDVIAEGAEHLAQLLALRDLGCDLVQGYGTGRPVRRPDVQRVVESSVLPTALRPARGWLGA